MKAILIGKNRELSWSDVPDPVLGYDDVLVKIEAAALTVAPVLTIYSPSSTARSQAILLIQSTPKLS